MRFLITGTAGFIGFHLAQRLLGDGHAVTGIDGITPYYDQTLKRRRHEILARFPQFAARELMLEEAGSLTKCVAESSAEIVIHLAAQAGVRYSIESPRTYIESNIVGTFNLLEALRAHPCRHVASTSSVYGANREQPFQEAHCTDHPLSLYAATKKATEAIACSYTSLFGDSTTVMRFFTVYGPWGRPDRLAELVPGAAEAGRVAPATASSAPYRVINIGGGRPVGLEDFIATIETAVGRKAVRRDLPMQPGDVSATWASTALLEQLTGFRPVTQVAEGARAFVAWYRDYYRV